MISGLNKIFENRIKLGVMSVLVVAEWVEFSRLKKMLEVTDGNLASHIRALMKSQYIEEKKIFIGRKPNTSYRLTNQGKLEFQTHVAALKVLLESN